MCHHSSTVTLVMQDTMTEPFNVGWFLKSAGKSQAHFSKNLLNKFLPNIFPVPLTDLSYQEAIFTQVINCLLIFVVANISLMNTVKETHQEQSQIKVLVFLSIHHNLAVAKVIHCKMPRGYKDGREKKTSVFLERALLT